MREDYSESGDAWNYFTHDQACSRAYRWSEDDLAGIFDDRQRLCFALALWNEKDPILKERLFGLSNAGGNHGEDVKEYYFYLDSTLTHSYMKYLYKYPQAAFPYDNLVATNRDRSRGEPEYELLDTGVFDQDRYFDVFVKYAKASPEDMLIQITVHNRGPEPATLQLLPTLWFCNDWSWGDDAARPTLRQQAQDQTGGVAALSHRNFGEHLFYAEGASALLFTGNETNTERLVGIVRRPDSVPCPNCTVGEWDMCRNGQYTERGIKQIDGFMSERWRIAPEYAIKVDSALGILGVLLEPTTVVAKAWEHVLAVGLRAFWQPKTVLVTGAGPIGLLGALLGKQLGLEVHVLAQTETGPKPELVRAIGATYHSCSVADVGFEPDVIMECTGVGQVISESLLAIGASSVVCLTGVGHGGVLPKITTADVASAIVLKNNVVFGSVNANKQHWYKAGRSVGPHRLRVACTSRDAARAAGELRIGPRAEARRHQGRRSVCRGMTMAN